MIILDTSSLIRFFTNDNKKMALKVKKLIESKNELYIPNVVFAELEYVLMGVVYGSPRDKVLEAYKYLVARDNIKVSTEVNKAVVIYEKTKLDMADCLVAAISINNKLASFDKDLLKVEGVKSYFNLRG
ncbi:hypothetical protein COV24_00955 [candidate division WWE3 bacterium CG10_big_fil_rev_8_21_14_0_10_32_10]|uniref:PIN domain-containing protein n=1 Tax=candidate division WWE3 bacterium CG10_big_fil_rev_8_21_14_0_10_32_10 TaxID=1975090 RepID=A0A2H0RBD3_UNCKA|nr:MAG: hypothetical protein COV24_00955 [candidate division WWE3 bacterium CG10_big_fil_rev_8_21_14_0_10_32_10]